MTVTAFIICFNEEAKLERCLKSLNWCDQIVVVDSGSTDRTLEIASKFTDKIYYREWSNYVEQKQFALEKCETDWVFSIDADEVVSEDLKTSILKALANESLEIYNGFLVNRVVYYLGRFWRKGGWCPEFRLRLARRSVAMIEGFLVHEKMTTPGKVVKLDGELYHYTFDSISDHVRRVDSLSTLHADAMFLEGKTVGLAHLLIYPTSRFFKFLFVRKAYREGLAGIAVAHIEALSTLLKYFKLWELIRNSKQLEDKKRLTVVTQNNN